MNKEINESMTLAKHISCEFRYTFCGRKCNSDQKWNNYKCQCDCKIPIRYWICEDVYAWNPSIGLGGCDKNFKIDE